MSELPLSGGRVALVKRYVSRPYLVIECHPVIGWRDVPADEADPYDFLPLMPDLVIEGNGDGIAAIGFVHDDGRVTNVADTDEEWPDFDAFTVAMRQQWPEDHAQKIGMILAANDPEWAAELQRDAISEPEQ